MLACAGLVPLAAAAQAIPGALEQQQLQRRQYQDELLLRGRQFQRQLDPALDPAQRPALQREQLDQRLQQEQLHQQQLQQHLPVQQTLPRQAEGEQRRSVQSEEEEFARQRQERLQRFERGP